MATKEKALSQNSCKGDGKGNMRFCVEEESCPTLAAGNFVLHFGQSDKWGATNALAVDDKSKKRPVVEERRVMTMMENNRIFL